MPYVAQPKFPAVLTLTLPKSAAAEEKVKRIAINSSGRGKKEDLAA